MYLQHFQFQQQALEIGLCVKHCLFLCVFHLFAAQCTCKHPLDSYVPSDDFAWNPSSLLCKCFHRLTEVKMFILVLIQHRFCSSLRYLCVFKVCLKVFFTSLYRQIDNLVMSLVLWRFQQCYAALLRQSLNMFVQK